MKQVVEIAKSFKAKGGHFIVGANFLGKIIAFFTSVFVVRYIEPEVFGRITYALSLVAFVVPFSGLGLQKSFLRFSSTLSDKVEIEELFRYAFKKGLLYALGLTGLVFILVTVLQEYLLAGITVFIKIIVFQLIGLFCFELISSYLLVVKDNKEYAFLQFLKPFLLFVFSLLLVPFLGGIGYVVILISIPFLTFIYGVVKMNLVKNLFSGTATGNKTPSFHKEFLKYGIHAGFGGVFSDLLYSVDIIMLGYLLANPVDIAMYKVAIIIPLNFLIIPLSYINTEFSTIAKEYKNRLFLVRYVKSYFIVFLLVSIMFLLVMMPFSSYWIELFFGENYHNGASIFNIAVIGVVGAMLFRVPFGNINSAIGKAHWNTYSALIVLFFNVVANYFCIKYLGVEGAAIATACSMWLAGIISFALFSNYLRKLPKKDI